MSYHVHQIDDSTHREFLAEQRMDPVMKKQFRAGDKVVFCAGGCGFAFLEDSWVVFLKKEHCEQSNTLNAIPPPRSKQGFLGKIRGGFRKNNTSTKAQSAGASAALNAGTRNSKPLATPIFTPVNSEHSPIRAFSTNTFSIRPGQSITLDWDVEANYDVSINRGIGNVINTGVQTVTPCVWFWGWPFLLNRRRTSYVLTARGSDGIFKQKLKIELALPALPVAIDRIVKLASHSVALSGLLPLRRQNVRLRQVSGLLDHNRLRAFLKLKRNQIKLDDYMALIRPPEIIRNLSKMPFYQRIPIAFFRRVKRWANAA